MCPYPDSVRSARSSLFPSEPERPAEERNPNFPASAVSGPASTEEIAPASGSRRPIVVGRPHVHHWAGLEPTRAPSASSLAQAKRRQNVSACSTV